MRNGVRHHLHQEHHQFTSHIDKIQDRRQTGNEAYPRIKSLEDEMNVLDQTLPVLAQVRVQIQKLNQKDREEVKTGAIEEVKIEDMKRKDQNYLELKMNDMPNELQNIQNQVIHHHINLSKIMIKCKDF